MCWEWIWDPSPLTKPSSGSLPWLWLMCLQSTVCHILTACDTQDTHTAQADGSLEEQLPALWLAARCCSMLSHPTKQEQDTPWEEQAGWPALPHHKWGEQEAVVTQPVLLLLCFWGSTAPCLGRASQTAWYLVKCTTSGAVCFLSVFI